MIRSFAISFLLFGLVSFVLALLPTDQRAVPAARSAFCDKFCYAEKKDASNEQRAFPAEVSAGILCGMLLCFGGTEAENLRNLNVEMRKEIPPTLHAEKNACQHNSKRHGSLQLL